MKVALHYKNMSTPPIGVWWPADDTPYVRRHYAEHDSPWEIRGRLLMGEKVQAVSWGDFFDHLAGRHIYFDVWEVAEIRDTWTPRQYLYMMRDIAETLLRKGMP